MNKFACICLLLFVPNLLSQDLAIKGNTQLQAYQLVVLEPSIDTTNKYAVWHVSPVDNVDKRIIGGKLIFVAVPGTYSVELTVIDFDKKNGSNATVKVTIGGGPNVTSLQTAYNQDTQADKADKVQILISVFKQCLPLIDGTQLATVGQLRNVLISASITALKDTDIPSIRKAVQTELDAKLGTKSNVPLDQNTKAVAKDTFNRIINELSGIK
jgi:hypothetical protein